MPYLSGSRVNTSTIEKKSSNIEYLNAYFFCSYFYLFFSQLTSSRLQFRMSSSEIDKFFKDENIKPKLKKITYDEGN